MAKRRMTSIATFSLGCFWEPDEIFSNLPGVIRTEVGYSGGTSINPTYHNLDGHTETVRIEFDSNKISYERLLENFWQNHEPTAQTPTQYKSIIFYHNKEQKEAAEVSKDVQEKNSSQTLLTEIRPAQEFYPAEEYHQKYLRKNHLKSGACAV